ncbi:MAG: NAD(P)H-quinone oxidoreductase [Candidatus Poribacteria bacterium]|nr:NAD(P)H-quinone oxidoreductase [Candidatus Poribacteria bacterium]MDE0504116.1 NAD(P)H-quinone oxidoreductase [Candidatus Poribacteria bacterium]
MKAIVTIESGGPEVLKLEEFPAPSPGPTQLLVNVKAAGINRIDTIQRKGSYPIPPGESEILGLEIAGTVERVGDNATGFKQGDRVFGLIGSGGYAEQTVIDYRMAMPIPEGWSFEEAAAVPEVFFTASETLFTFGKLSAGETVLIHAGGSGVGTTGTQMAHQIGARVFITAGSAEKIERSRSLGCTEGINYKKADFGKEIMQLTEGEGVEVVQDFIGAPYLERNLAILKPRGRLVVVGLMGGSAGEIDMGVILRKRLQIFGSVMRALPLEDKISITERFINRWLPLLREGKIKAIIDTVFPLSQACEAHEYMEANKNFGKILLKVD